MYTVSEWYSTDPESEFSLKEARAVGFNPLPAGKLIDRNGILKVTLLSDNCEKLIIEELLSGSGLSIRRLNPFYLEVCSPNALKYSAFKKVIYNLEIKDPFIFAVGDSENDIDLLKNSDFPCTVGNATRKVIACSKYQSKKDYGEGALDCIEKIAKKLIKDNKN